MESELYKIAWWIFFSSIKFFYAPGSVYIVGSYSFWETLILTVIGGWMGVIFFYFFGKIIFIFLHRFTQHFKKKPKEAKQKFSRINKIIISVKNHRWGLIGLALLTPSLLSIPIGAVIAAKYFRDKKETIPVLMTAVLIWGIILTTLVSIFNIRLNP